MSNYVNREGGKERRKKAYNYLVQKGMSPHLAAGVVGNLMQESYSHLDSSVEGAKLRDGTRAVGIAQWAKSRRVNLEAYAKKKGKDYKDFDLQLDFLHHELTANGAGAWRNQKEKEAFYNAASVEEASNLFSKYFERPGKSEANNARRLKLAANVYLENNDNAVYAKTPKGSIINVNPEVATPKEIANSDVIRGEFYDTMFKDVASGFIQEPVKTTAQGAKELLEQKMKEEEFVKSVQASQEEEQAVEEEANTQEDLKKDLLSKVFGNRENKTEAPTPQRAPSMQPTNIRTQENEFYSAFLPEGYRVGGDVDGPDDPPPGEPVKKLTEEQKQRRAKSEERWGEIQNEIAYRKSKEEARLSTLNDNHNKAFNQMSMVFAAATPFGLEDVVLNKALPYIPKVYKAAKEVVKKARSIKGRTAVGDAAKPLKEVAQGAVSFGREVVGEVTKGKANKKAIAEGNEWLDNWIQDPATKNKLEEMFTNPEKYYGKPQNIMGTKQYVKNLEELSSVLDHKPIVKEYPLSNQLAEFILEKDNLHRGNYGVSYTNANPYKSRYAVKNTPKTIEDPYSGSWISRRKDLDQAKRASTTVHEGTHDWFKKSALDNSGTRQMIEEMLTPKQLINLKEWELARVSNKVGKMDPTAAYEAYMTNPTEVHARVMEIRKHFNLKPGVEVTQKQVFDILDNLDAAPIDAGGFSEAIGHSPTNLKNLLNKLPAITGTAGVGTVLANQEEIEQYHEGGEIHNQSQHPHGENTIEVDKFGMPISPFNLQFPRRAEDYTAFEYTPEEIEVNAANPTIDSEAMEQSQAIYREMFAAKDREQAIYDAKEQARIEEEYNRVSGKIGAIDRDFKKELIDTIQKQKETTNINPKDLIDLDPEVLKAMEGDPAYTGDLEDIIDPKPWVRGEEDYSNLNTTQVRELQRELVASGDLKVKLTRPKTSNDVVELQTKLVAAGYDLGTYGENKDGIDGKYGTLTSKALKDYNKGLTTVDGDLGTETKKALKGRSSKHEINDRFFELQEDTDIVQYQTNLEDQGYFQGIDYEQATDEDIIASTKIVPQEKELSTTAKIKEFFSIDGGEGEEEEEGREAPSCNFAPIPGSKSNDSRCTAFVGDEIEKSVGEEGRKAAGAYGDAWTVSQNIIGAGGEAIYSIYEETKPNLTPSGIEPYIKGRVKSQSTNLSSDMFREGDVINLFYEGSGFKEEAYANSGNKFFTTHTGIVKKNAKGELFIEHNVDGKVSREPLQRMIDNKVKHSGKDISVTSIIRPNYSKTYYDSSTAQVKTKNVDDLSGIGSKNAALFTETIIKNKKALMGDMPINEEEFNNLTKVAKSIGWKETSFDNIKLEENPRDWNPKHDAYDRLGEIRDTFGAGEKSRGMTRLKDEKNLTPELRKKYIKNEGRNLENATEAAIPTFYAVGSRYLYLRDLNSVEKLGMSKNELAKLAMLGWNEKINIVGESMKKYKTFDAVMKAYRTDSKTGEEVGHAYDLAQTAYNDYLQ